LLLIWTLIFNFISRKNVWNCSWSLFKNDEIVFFVCQMAAGYRNCNRIVVVASVAIVTFAYALQIVTADKVNPVDLQAGDFCAKVGCCSERNENCSVPISGTLCYCDEFCYVNRTGSEDCCPDYMSYCKVEFLAPEPIIYKRK